MSNKLVYENLFNDLNKLGEKYAGAYLMNKFFIRIITNTKRSEIPSYDYKNHNFSNEDQLKLQQQNYPTLYHEYIHYIHEVSTMAGITQFYLNVFNRAIFSGFVDTPNSSNVKEVTGAHQEQFINVNRTLGAVTGGSLHDLNDRKVYQIDQVDFIDFKAYEPSRDVYHNIRIPMLTYSYLGRDKKSTQTDSVFFGKYFIYEGLAHHLDQLVTVQLGGAKFKRSEVQPEYRIMEMVTKFYLPDIEERDMLEMASLSLCYFNCGERFIRIIQEAVGVHNLPGYIMEIKNEVIGHLTTHKENIVFTLNEIKNVFINRDALFQAAGHLCDVMAESYDQRLNNPVFEIDITYSGRLREMANIVKPCDMVYELADEELYMRDFAGTYLPTQLAIDLKTLMCHVDYYQTMTSKKDEHCCPLYNFCPHDIRVHKPEQCKRKPRLAFEDQKVYGWCQYGLGVAYMTGQERKSDDQDN